MREGFTRIGEAQSSFQPAMRRARVGVVCVCFMVSYMSSAIVIDGVSRGI